MRLEKQKAVVAGHICLDLIPVMDAHAQQGDPFLLPGSLHEVGPVLKSSGGAVPNTGLALHRLGMDTVLMGKVGGDSFGRELIGLLDRYGDSLTKGMIVDDREHTSYTIIISPPGIDRIFLHHPGANNSFCCSDVDDAAYADASLFHFGYPPFLRKMAENQGGETVALLRRLKRIGITTSLDMAKPDPTQSSGKVDWLGYLQKTLPLVDVFLPSIEELWYMLEPDGYVRWMESAGSIEIATEVDSTMLRRFSDRLLQMGAGVIVIKLGDQGLYVRTSGHTDRLERMGGCAPSLQESWLNKEYLAPCFQVEVVGTTGAGDCTIAGFLAGMMEDWPLEKVLNFAAGVGACNVETTDATSGIPHGHAVLERIANGWKRRSVRLSLPEWHWKESMQIYVREDAGC